MTENKALDLVQTLEPPPDKIEGLVGGPGEDAMVTLIYLYKGVTLDGVTDWERKIVQAIEAHGLQIKGAATSGTYMAPDSPCSIRSTVLVGPIDSIPEPQQ